MTQSKLQPPMRGPYSRRAEIVAKALAERLRKMFDDRLQPTKRSSDQNLTFRWDLPANVAVVVQKGMGNADPSIWIRRGDPQGKTMPDGDWKNTEIKRAYKDKSYDLDAIEVAVKEAVAYNEHAAGEHQKNAKAMTTELDGIPVTGGTEIVRDPKSGLYTIRQTITVKDVNLERAKKTLLAINQIADAMLEKKSEEKPEEKRGQEPKKEGGSATE